MIVYRDILSGDEMMSDAFKLLPVVDSEGAVVSEIFDLFAVDPFSSNLYYRGFI